MAFTQTKTFNINESNVSLDNGDKLIFKLVLKGSTTANFTASLTQGSLNNSSLCNYNVGGNAVAGWSDKDPLIGNYLTTGDYIFTRDDLTTVRVISGYVMQWVDASSPVGQVYEITNGQFGDLQGSPAC